MKNKEVYMEYFIFWFKFFIHFLVCLGFAFLIMTGVISMLHIFFDNQSLSGTSDYVTEAGDFIFVPSINLIKKIIIATVGKDFESSKIDYMSVYGFVMFCIGSIGMRIYLKFFDKE